METTATNKSLSISIEKADSSEYDARFVMSASTPDRVQDTIDPKAYKAAAASHEKLIALWQHDPSQVCGYWTNLQSKGDTLVGHLKIAGTNLGRMIKTLILDDVPLSASIGFRGKGKPNEEGGYHFKEIELLETSIVSIPAHPRAQQIAKSFGYESLVEETDNELAASGLDVDPAMVVTKSKAAILRANKLLRKK